MKKKLGPTPKIRVGRATGNTIFLFWPNLVSLKTVKWHGNTSFGEFNFIDMELKILGVTSPRLYINETKH